MPGIFQSALQHLCVRRIVMKISKVSREIVIEVQCIILARCYLIL